MKIIIDKKEYDLDVAKARQLGALVEIPKLEGGDVFVCPKGGEFGIVVDMRYETFGLTGLLGNPFKAYYIPGRVAGMSGVTAEQIMKAIPGWVKVGNINNSTLEAALALKK